MKFKDHSVEQILVGLHKIGIVGLSGAIKASESSGLKEREAIVDLMLDTLASRNYIPEHMSEAYRIALWREYLRHRGQDFIAYCTEVPVIVRGRPGPERDRFVEVVRSVLAGLELRPVVTFESKCVAGPEPQLEIRDEIVAQGSVSRRTLERAIRFSFSDW